MEKNNPKIGIIGVGMVGGALKTYFGKKGLPLFLYDKGKNIGSPAEAGMADLVFVCVPTPFEEDKGFDFSYVEEACGILTGEKVVVIKSTVLPGSTQALQNKFLQHKFLFNPEFLTEATAQEDFEKPGRQIVGFTDQSRDQAKFVLDLLPDAPYKKIMPAKEAEMVKYFGNTWFSIKVSFANQMYDLCQKLNINYDLVKEAAGEDKMVGKTHLEIFHKNYRGYGGKCLPKDIKALIRFADENGIDLKLHKTAERINQELIDRQANE